MIMQRKNMDPIVANQKHEYINNMKEEHKHNKM